MRTILLPPDEAGIREASEALRAGQVVGMPTETVYGLAANALDPQAVLKIFEAKGRPADNPLIVHIASLGQIHEVASTFSPTAQKLADAFWPGPLTMILPRHPNIPNEVTAGLETVGVRMPSHPVARQLIEASGLPLAAPSANRSGKPSPTTAEHVLHDMDGRIPLIVDGGNCGVGVESTVVSVGDDAVRILRPGKISPEDFEKVVSEVTIDRGVLESVAQDAKVASPGMKYKHYAPNANVVMVEGSLWDFVRYVRAHADHSTGVLAFEEDRAVLQLPFFRYGYAADSESQAEELFDALRLIDEAGLKTVYARMPRRSGIGLALYNRLLRACAFQVVHLNHPMQVVGLTGPTGSGKTSVSAVWARRGAQIINCDRVARELHQDAQVLLSLSTVFGSDILNSDHSLNRSRLAARAFATPEGLQKLNDIMLPPIIERTLQLLEEYQQDGCAVSVLDAPTLFESGLDAVCDVTVALEANRDTRADRIIQRDHLTKREVANRMQAQHGAEFYRERADVVLVNDGDLKALHEKAGEWFDGYAKEHGLQP